MKLVTFQSLGALKDLINKGYLECNEEYIDLRKAGVTYSWVLEKMDGKIEDKMNAKYPIWCWVRCYNNICPSKHKGKQVEGFDVKISFTKSKEVKEKYSSTKVIMVTADNMEKTLQYINAYGADALVTKPFLPLYIKTALELSVLDDKARSSKFL